jgi:hypothetical protein
MPGLFFVNIPSALGAVDIQLPAGKRKITPPPYGKEG